MCWVDTYWNVVQAANLLWLTYLTLQQPRPRCVRRWSYHGHTRQKVRTTNQGFVRESDYSRGDLEAQQHYQPLLYSTNASSCARGDLQVNG